MELECWVVISECGYCLVTKLAFLCVLQIDLFFDAQGLFKIDNTEQLRELKTVLGSIDTLITIISFH